MSSAIERISILHYSPYILTPVFESFYENTVTKPNNILLSYLLLPLIMHPDTRRFFKNSRKTSTLHTFCSTRERMFGLAERIQELKEITNHCLFLAKESGSIEFDNDMAVLFKKRTLENTATSPDMMTAAKKLSTLLCHYDVPTCYRILGIKQL